MNRLNNSNNPIKQLYFQILHAKKVNSTINISTDKLNNVYEIKIEDNFSGSRILYTLRPKKQAEKIFLP